LCDVAIEVNSSNARVVSDSARTNDNVPRLPSPNQPSVRLRNPRRLYRSHADARKSQAQFVHSSVKNGGTASFIHLLKFEGRDHM
jgi:hypothetical protein